MMNDLQKYWTVKRSCQPYWRNFRSFRPIIATEPFASPDFSFCAINNTGSNNISYRGRRSSEACPCVHTFFQVAFLAYSGCHRNSLVMSDLSYQKRELSDLFREKKRIHVTTCLYLPCCSKVPVSYLGEYREESLRTVRTG